MALVITTDTDKVVALAEALVARDPVAYTVFGSIAFGAQEDGSAPWAAHPQGAPLTLAARSNPHTPVAFTQDWTDLTEVSAAIAAIDPPPAGIGGPPEVVCAVADELGLPVTRCMQERLFRLDELIAPRPSDGRARRATADDLPWLIEWYRAFGIEAFGYAMPGLEALITRRLPQSRCWVWTDDAGVPRSFAVAHPPVDGVSRIGPVYTAPDARGRGYGSWETAAASREILESGNVACLYTDLANPTSNKIYRQLGYRPVLDRTTIRFD